MPRVEHLHRAPVAAGHGLDQRGVGTASHGLRIADFVGDFGDREHDHPPALDG